VCECREGYNEQRQEDSSMRYQLVLVVIIKYTCFPTHKGANTNQNTLLVAHTCMPYLGMQQLSTCVGAILAHTHTHTHHTHVDTHVHALPGYAAALYVRQVRF
jgi:hypothetical protein